MTAASDGVRVVLTTIDDHAGAERLARALLDEHLIACANLVPGITSIYRWRGEIQTGGETLLLLKTRDRMLSRLVGRLAELHPYELPEVVCLPRADTSVAYGEWVATETAGVAT